MQTQTRVPFRHMALESLEYRKFSQQSDVWSFGILAWEVYAYGALPYDDISPMDLPALLRSGQRLGQPPACSDGAFKIMLKCWTEHPGAHVDPIAMMNYIHISRQRVVLFSVKSPAIWSECGPESAPSLSLYEISAHCSASHSFSRAGRCMEVAIKRAAVCVEVDYREHQAI